MKILMPCILLAVAVANASAHCFTGGVIKVKHKWSDDVMEYCVYKKMHFMVGTNFIDAGDCMSCSCNHRELICCGIGYNGAPMNVPGCKVVPDLCSVAVLNSTGTGLCFQ